MSIILSAFTWVGGICCTCGTLVALLWVLDAAGTQLIRSLGWMRPFVLFVLLDSRKKEELKRQAAELHGSRHKGSA